MIYLFEYPFDGAMYSLEIPAESREEAEARFRNIQYGHYKGELMGKVPAMPGVGLLVRLRCWWRNHAS